MEFETDSLYSWKITSMVLKSAFNIQYKCHMHIAYIMSFEGISLAVYVD